ncbi:HAD family hydrolase [Streptomyces sp. NPDC006530]|uniref:HAD family hydrolase n=1 Tax=Streptomyces sp. NPDC006530 TaxID=3364750 RepID=UPI0036B7B255
MSPRAVLLDFDGLMCDTERAARRSWEETWAYCGLVFPHGLWRRMQGRSDGESIALDSLAAALGRPVTADLRDRRRRRKQELSDLEPLRPGVAELIEGARSQGLPVAVVSSSRADWVEGHVARLAVGDRFAFVLSGRDAERHKPAPDLYLAALDRLGPAGVDARAVLALEDSPVGVRAARAAGMRCVAVPSSVGDAALLTAADAVVAAPGAYLLEADWKPPNQTRDR